MNQVTLEINGNSYKLKFGISCLRILGAMWEIPTLNGVLARVSKLDGLTGDNIPFEVLDILEGVIVASVKAEKSNTFIESDFENIVEYMFENMDKIEAIFSGLLQSMPVADSGKSKAPRGASKKN